MEISSNRTGIPSVTLLGGEAGGDKTGFSGAFNACTGIARRTL
jgi:hypothetical protein